jgi:hypothetical protein
MREPVIAVAAALALAGCAVSETDAGDAGRSQLELSLWIVGDACGTYSLDELTRIKHERESDDDD